MLDEICKRHNLLRHFLVVDKEAKHAKQKSVDHTGQFHWSTNFQLWNILHVRHMFSDYIRCADHENDKHFKS